MQGMSERQYSAHSELSRGAIQKAKRNGRMVLYGDGSINAAASDARRAGMTDPDQQRRSVASNESSISGPAESSSYLKARTALTVYQAQEHQLSIQKKKGALVDRAQTEALVFRLARQERDVWVTWPARVAALMAAQVPCNVILRDTDGGVEICAVDPVASMQAIDNDELKAVAGQVRDLLEESVKAA